MADQQKRNIVIIGGGIIGCTTAYFLSHHLAFDRERDSITLLEATEIAGGASGKAGGLLALWAYPECIVGLSYRLHKELAELHDGASRWGYRTLHCGQVDAIARPPPSSNDNNNNPKDAAPPTPPQSLSLQKRRKSTQEPTTTALLLLRKAGVPPDVDWLDPTCITAYTAMGTPSTTAQVHPYQFTTSMARLAEEKGVNIIYGTATKIHQEEDAAVTGVTYIPKNATPEEEKEGKYIQADTVILTAGPWTRTLYPSAPISALRAHSVTIRPSKPVSAYALFTSIELPNPEMQKGGKSMRGRTQTTTVTPEIYARPNNEVYACGSGDTLVPLPLSTSAVQVDPARCADVVAHVCSISPALREGEVTARQACYLPTVDTGGGPLVGRTSVKGLLIGAGHSCWGIQNAPGTGRCLSEVVWEGEVRSAEVGGLDPRGFGL
ncbi:FAD dependent oxidoreductase [Westerdykella ornata]|uniref:FAD dependent oxidoreductase n=1 Tax=Westerdykella ornata TaxID=318751 RepID=A0A6A6JWZ5_WESOR|nr:FAD dependent oxidoreductase [Westerdykella ornata]KAF2280338.1 FAD dependent oxidoreductase [Westerdykella ornata]